jgi:hypothetical protein
VSWYAHPKVGWEYHGPWWVSGRRPIDEDWTMQDMCCAAVVAECEEAAKQVIVDSHDEPVELEWRFVEARGDAWEPFCDRFPRAGWMRWPWPE